MKKALSFKSGRRVLLAAAVSLAPLTAAQAVSPLGFDIPQGSSMAATSVQHETDWSRPLGPSPLGFEIPAPAPRGAAGPMRQDWQMVGSFDRGVRANLAGIGGENTE